MLDTQSLLPTFVPDQVGWPEKTADFETIRNQSSFIKSAIIDCKDFLKYLLYRF